MQKIITACVLLALLVFLQTNAFAYSLNCKFQPNKVSGIQTLTLLQGVLLVNEELAIPLKETTVKCGHLGFQRRMEGKVDGLSVVLKTCSTDVQVKGYIVDFQNEKSADVHCDQAF